MAVSLLNRKVLRHNLIYHAKNLSFGKETIMNVFDRKAKSLQRDRAAIAENSHLYDYLKDEVGHRVADRVYDIKRLFPLAVDLGCGKGHLSKNLTPDSVSTLIQCETSKKCIELSQLPKDIPSTKILVDEENLPFRENSVDMFLSSLSLHWVNNLPGTFSQVRKALKPDGVFIASVFGGETLFELRCSLQLAEIEREGGFSPHISPFTTIQDLGSLLNRAGFNMLTIDCDEIVVGYPSMLELMTDLKGMGESNAAWSRKLRLKKDTILAATSIYKNTYGNEDGSIPATFQIIYFIGWKPDKSQPVPAERGSATVSLKDLETIMKKKGNLK